MDRLSKLPVTNDLGYYEVRMESIGGLGANLAGKILAEAGVLEQGLNGSNFASYGSEKQGSPVKAFVRFCDPKSPVYINSPVERPHLLIIFHENLIKTQNVTQGLYPDSVIVINTTRSPEEMRDAMKLASGKIYCIDAQQLAIETKSRINTVMLGAISKASGFLEKAALEERIRKTFEKKYPKLVESNLTAFRRGFEEVQGRSFEEDGKYPPIQFARKPPVLGFLNAPIGGIIPNPGNSVLKDHTATRSGYVPVLIKDNCTSCAECEMTCPDYCFAWEKRKDDKGKEKMTLVGIDYTYCKGCMKCVEICKFQALDKKEEKEVDIDALLVKVAL